MKYGDKILWQYTHQNGRSRFERIKEGEFQAIARHTAIHWRKNNAAQMAWVHFKGNKNWSKVPLDELKHDYRDLERRLR